MADQPHTIPAEAEAQAPATQIADVAESAQLVERAREGNGQTIRATWRFSLDTVRDAIHYMEPDARELLVWCFQWCIDPAHPVAFADFCDRIGYSENLVWKAYVGKLRHPTAKDFTGKPALMGISAAMLKALRDFRRVEVQRSKLGRKQFVVTPTARRIFTACDLARESQTPVFVEGASHIGKTEGFKQYCIENNHGKSRLIELEAVNGLHGLIKATAVVVGVSPNGNAADMTERIKKAISSDMVLIFDEVHLLANTYRRGSFFACMEWIRRLYDFRQFGLVLSFTELGFAQVEAARKRELEQLFRRGVHRVNLGDRPTVADVRMIVESWGLDFPARKDVLEIRLDEKTVVLEEPYKMLEQLSGEQGMKAIVERLRYAAKLAADREQSVGWEDVVRTHLIVQKNAMKPKHGWGEAKEAA